MAKRKRQDEIVLLFDLIIQALKREGTDLPPKVLKKLKAELLPPEANTMVAKEFSLALAIETFELEYPAWGPAALWKIDDIPETKTFSPRPSLGTVSLPFGSCTDDIMPLEPTLELYAKTVDRSSEAACRTPIDILLFECIGELVSISLIFLSLRFNDLSKGNQKRRAMVDRRHQRLISTSSFVAKCRSPTNSPGRQPPSTGEWITASVLSSRPVAKFQIAFFIPFFFPLKLNPKTVLNLLYLSLWFTWDAYVKLGRHVDVAIAQSMALLRTAFSSPL